MQKRYEEYLDKNDWDNFSFSSDDSLEEFTVNLFCGYFRSIKLKNYSFSIFSFISCNKIGPRFYCRGVDDSGDVSFFVKTEIEFIFNNKKKKLVILRGSIPLFWYQDKNPLRKKLKYSREKDVSKQALKKHFDDITKDYKNICVVNLLGNSENEKNLSIDYIECLEENHIKYINFDLNKYASDYDKMKKLFIMELENVKESVIFRVNCLDCLDRTNIAQFMIAENYFKDAFEDKKILFNILKDLFVKNGHALSNFYCGADSLKSELALKGKRTVTGIFDDLFINANRLISAKYNDKIKFEIINTMLEKEDKEIIKDFANFNLNENYHFYVLTWCLNNFKYDHKFNFDINIDKKISFVVISLQKINTSYKKLFFDEKQTERVKWKEFFEMKFCDFTLISQNFSHNLGLLLFTRNEIKMEITNINAIKTKKEIFSSLMSICINFNFRNKNFCIANSILQFEKSFIEKTKKHLNFINLKADYLFMTGYFQSKLFINEDEISFLFDTQEYEKIISNDFLYNHMDIIGNLEEGEISFLPNVEDLKKKDYKYSTRIFFNEFCKSLEYKDIEVTKTGFKPVYGIFYLKK